MTDELAQVIAGSTVPAVVGSIVTLVGLWLTSRRTDRKVDQVAQLAAPTDQAWAERVELALADIRADVRNVRDEQLRHLHEHATHRGWFGH